MKASLILVVVVSASTQVIAEDQKERVKKYRQECIEKTTVQPELIDRADKGDFADDKNLKCFAKCFYEKVGFINGEAELQFDVIKSKIPSNANRERALGIIEKCKDIKGADPCDKAYAIHKCYYEKSAKENQQDGRKVEKKT